MASRSYQLTIPEEKTVMDFGIRFIGINKEKPIGLVRNHCGISSLFFLFIHDKAEINGDKTDKGVMIIWPPGKAHNFGSASEVWSHSWIKFLGGRSISIFNEYNIPISEPIYLKKTYLFEKYTTLILEEIRPYVNPDIRIIEGLYRLFLMEIERDISGGMGESSIPENIQRVKDLIDTEYYKDLTLQSLGEKSLLATNYLTSEFKKYYGHTVINYLIQVRIFHAKALLGNLNLNIGEIAGEVGYYDAFHFSHLFKKHTGLSPRSYRRMLNKL